MYSALVSARYIFMKRSKKDEEEERKDVGKLGRRWKNRRQRGMRWKKGIY